jgi:signal transduction histidine kinase
MFVTAFTRDMRGAQLSLLAPARLHDPSDVHERVTSGFARFQYPENFFVWPDPSEPASVRFHVRTDQYPSWLPPRTEVVAHLPTVVTPGDPTAVQWLTDRIAADAKTRKRYSIFNIVGGNTPYQVVALLTYADAYRERFAGAFGFMVNLAWVRQYYFQDLTAQISRAANIEAGLTLNVRDEHGAVIVGTAQPGRNGGSASRALPFAFFDPIVADVEPPFNRVVETWSAEAVVSEDPMVRAANTGARQTTLLGIVAASLIMLSYFLMSHAATQSAKLVEMRTTFVQGVTHELKTPVSTIRAIGETFAGADEVTLESAKEFARVSVEEAKRLTRLIDNLLAYSRVTDVIDVYQFEPVSLESLIKDVMRDFSSHFGSERRIDLQVNGDIAPVRADVTAMRLVFSNLIDNAIRYAPDAPFVRVGISQDGAMALIEIEDRGRGIPESELANVTRKFFRGRSASSGGSGLGLAIAQRIVTDHLGTMDIRSMVGKGTLVSIKLPFGS